MLERALQWNNDWSKLRTADQTLKKKKKKKTRHAKGHRTLCQCSHTCITSASGPSLIALSLKTGLLDYFRLNSASSWQHGRQREKDCLSTRWRPSFRLGPCPPPPRLAHHQLLAVVDLLIDAATETHWNHQGLAPWPGPMHCSLCMLLSKNAPSLIATFNITENILCFVLKRLKNL